MRILTAMMLILGLWACQSEPANYAADQQVEGTEVVKADVASKKSYKERSPFVSRFLIDVSVLRRVEEGNPISLFQEQASEDASQVMNLTSENIEEVLSTASEYRHCVLTTGNHTIVKIINLEDCEPSGSWGACMPKVQGYIKKGDLIFKEGYMNNVIGKVDEQVRTAYFF